MREWVGVWVSESTKLSERGGVEWSGVEWSGVEWSGVEWSGVEWSGVEWSAVQCSAVQWSGVEWSGVDGVPQFPFDYHDIHPPKGTLVLNRPERLSC